MSSIDLDHIRQQLQMCEDAVQAMKAYRDAIGVRPEAEIAELRQRAEFFWGLSILIWRLKTANAINSFLGQN